MAKDWAIIKYAAYLPNQWNTQFFTIVIHKPSFGESLSKHEVIADNLTEEEAHALKTLIGE